MHFGVSAHSKCRTKCAISVERCSPKGLGMLVLWVCFNVLDMAEHTEGFRYAVCSSLKHLCDDAPELSSKSIHFLLKSIPRLFGMLMISVCSTSCAPFRSSIPRETSIPNKFRYAVYALDQKHTQKESLHLMLTFSVPDDAT